MVFRFAVIMLLTGCGPAVMQDPEELPPYRPLPTSTLEIERGEACLRACAHLKQLGCAVVVAASTPCEDWLCNADFYNYTELAIAKECPE